MPRHISRYGWHASPPDHRDRFFHLEEKIYRGPQLPTKVDLWPHVPSIWNQGEEGSCTAHGSLRALCTELMKQGASMPTPPAEGAPFSRQAQYYWTRQSEGTTGTDSGGTVRDAVAVLAKIGAAPETLWPYSEPLTEEPSASVRAAAAGNVAVKYQSILVGGPGDPMRTALASGLAVVFGFSVPESFEDGSWDPANQVLGLPSPFEGFIGGHCVCITGYDWTCEDFPEPYWLVDNSWGSTWGDEGRFRMSWDWFDPSLQLATDLWVVQSVT